MPRTPARRLATLETPEGLRAAILVQAYSLQIKGAPTPARLRATLAATALRRAFGDDAAGRLAGKLQLSVRAGRLLAAQLLARPRDFATDTRRLNRLSSQADRWAIGSDRPAIGLGGTSRERWERFVRGERRA